MKTLGQIAFEAATIPDDAGAIGYAELAEDGRAYWEKIALAVVEASRSIGGDDE